MTEDVLLMVAIPIFMLTIGIEFGWMRLRPSLRWAGYTLRDTWGSLSMGMGFLVASGVAKLAVVPFYYWLYEYRLFEIGDAWWTWPLLIVLQDFCFYWAHRTHHEVRFMWAAHVNHHSSQHYNLSTALRQSWTEHLTALPFYLPLILLGFDPLTLMVVELLNLFYQYWVHTEVVGKLGWFGWVFNTPSHHRVHHGSNPEYLDRNHAGMFIIWDRMFGTFQPEEAPVRYGLTRNIDTHNPFRIAFHEWHAMFRDVRTADHWRDALGYVFRPPGWGPQRQGDSAEPAATPLPETTAG